MFKVGAEGVKVRRSARYSVGLSSVDEIGGHKKLTQKRKQRCAEIFFAAVVFALGNSKRSKRERTDFSGVNIECSSMLKFSRVQ